VCSIHAQRKQLQDVQAQQEHPQQQNSSQDGQAQNSSPDAAGAQPARPTHPTPAALPLLVARSSQNLGVALEHTPSSESLQNNPVLGLHDKHWAQVPVL
jgi:hypothetical protein